MNKNGTFSSFIKNYLFTTIVFISEPRLDVNRKMYVPFADVVKSSKDEIPYFNDSLKITRPVMSNTVICASSDKSSN